ncbi:MAG: hypothetical protein JSS31_14655 [Proteobacteria bacterium]|nr:hypothetical protein [Pseudomonadota bacterium]MBS0495154.1 hypothetical protein [Pseudomonadota bacterium]
MAVLVLLIGFAVIAQGATLRNGELFTLTGMLAVGFGLAMFFTKPKPAAPVAGAELISLGELDE